MENLDSETVLLACGAMVVKYKQCSFLYKNIYRQKLLKLYKIYLEVQRQESEKVNRRFWVRDIFITDQRLKQGVSNNLVAEMRKNDRQKFINFFRMSPEIFDHLLTKVEPYIRKQNAVREAIEARFRLEITLRYLASSDSMVSLSYSFRVGKQTVSTIVSETCNALWESLKDEVLMEPNEENWKKIAKEFEDKWNFKHCIGAIDGKHIIMQALPNSGSKYYNYKGSHSINLLAIVDVNYKFIMVDIGAAGRLSDSGVFKDSQMGQGFENNLLNIPSDDNFPYVLVGDEAFPLSNYLMRPYPRSGQLNMKKKVFNYRLSRARRIVENAFGILVTKWRIFRKPIIASESTIRKIVQACVCLHNFLLMQRSEETMHNEELGEMSATTDGLTDITRAGSNTYSRHSAAIRDRFADYFLGDGAVEWQWEKALQNDF